MSQEHTEAERIAHKIRLLANRIFCDGPYTKDEDLRDLDEALDTLLAAVRREASLERSAIYRKAASAMCAHCAAGDDPKWMVTFGGMTHTWKTGNGHSSCSAAKIWEELLRANQEGK